MLREAGRHLRAARPAPREGLPFSVAKRQAAGGMGAAVSAPGQPDPQGGVRRPCPLANATSADPSPGPLPAAPAPRILGGRPRPALPQGHREQGPRRERATAGSNTRAGHARVGAGRSCAPSVTAGRHAFAPPPFCPVGSRRAGGAHLPLPPVSLVQAPAWAPTLSFLCVFLGLSLKATEGQYLPRGRGAVDHYQCSSGDLLLPSSAPRTHLLPPAVLSATNLSLFPPQKCIEEMCPEESPGERLLKNS